MRHLATIQKIEKLLPIEGADKIEVAQVNGWQVVVKKGEFFAGDLCVYFEIDSFLPIDERYEFLRKSSYRNVIGLGEGFRLKTIRLRGQVSQGLCLPLSAFPELNNNEVFIGSDVSEKLRVIKYDPPVPAQLQGQVRGNFPSFVPKTDQERIQNIFDRVTEWIKEGVGFVVEEKLDGSSCTVYKYHGEIGVCSRNLELKISSENSSNAFILATDGIRKAIDTDVIIGNFAIQGEVVGPGIQGNWYELSEPTFVVFDVYDIDRGCYVTAQDRETFIRYIENATGYKLNVVPTIGIWSELQDDDVAYDLATYLNAANGYSDFTEKKKAREGIVFKSMDYVNGDVVSFKVISNDWLLSGRDE